MSFVPKCVFLMLLAFSCLSSGTSWPQQPSSFRGVRQFNYSIGFESNTGWTSPQVRFVGHGSNYSVFLTPDGAVFALKTTRTRKDKCSIDSQQLSKMRMQRTSCVSTSGGDFTRLHLLGTNLRADAEGRKELSSYSNYIVGNDPTRWHTHVPQFAEVWYSGIYPGIDLVYYSNDGRTEYDFIVAPRANPGRIQFSVDEPGSGAAIRVNAEGGLVVPAGRSKLVLHKPLLFQGESCGQNRPFSESRSGFGCRALSGGKFRIRRTGGSAVRVSFQLPPYDHNEPLVIDPSVSFSTFLGGSMGDGAFGMTLDADGNIYLIGDTNSPDFPTTSGAYQKNLSGDVDAFVVKLSGDGSHIIYSTYLGGSGPEFPHGIAIDSAKNAYLTGETYSTDFPLVHPYQTQNISGTGFVSKLSPDGSSLIYSTYLGGTYEGASNAIAVDSSGEAVVVGRIGSTDFPVVNAFQPTHAADNGSSDAFITKFSGDGTSLIFSTYFGGDENDTGQGVALDPSGNIYVSGITSSTDFPTTPGAYQPMYIADPWYSSFIAKFSPSGTSLTYSTYLVDCWAFGIAVNASGNAFVTGLAGWFAFPTTPGAFQTVQGGGSSTDAFVTEFDSTGSSLVYSTFLGGSNSDVGYGIALDSSNDAYVTGQTYSSNFPLKNPLQTVFYPGVPTVFVSELDGTGSALAFSTYWGGGAAGFGSSQGNAIAVGALGAPGNFYVAGATEAPDFPVVNAIQSQLRGGGDAFIAKFGVPPDFTAAGSPESQTVSAGGTATYALTLLPINGFAGSVSLSCSGAPRDSNCTISPLSVTLDGTHSGTATVTVKTMARSANVRSGIATGFRPGTTDDLKRGFGGVFALAVLCFTIPMTVRRRGTRSLGVMTLLLVSSLLVACGGGGSGGGGGGGGGGTPPGSYTIIVKASSGNLNHSVNLKLNVN
jgi:hypothetical protein